MQETALEVRVCRKGTHNMLEPHPNGPLRNDRGYLLCRGCSRDRVNRHRDMRRARGLPPQRGRSHNPVRLDKLPVTPVMIETAELWSHYPEPDYKHSISANWMDEANCRNADPALFYDKGRNQHTYKRNATRAKVICAACPVRRNCLSYAVIHGERYGIWGGATEEERLQARRIAGLGDMPDHFDDGINDDQLLVARSDLDLAC